VASGFVVIIRYMDFC